MFSKKAASIFILFIISGCSAENTNKNANKPASNPEQQQSTTPTASGDFSTLILNCMDAKGEKATAVLKSKDETLTMKGEVFHYIAPTRADANLVVMDFKTRDSKNPRYLHVDMSKPVIFPMQVTAAGQKEDYRCESSK
ncbi:hypothetical protein [Pseudocitrobacter cyperus]|uniref:Lipoprotein n=1 Tax=Pseudocitrobacter cyperus TaxID=3112843 RepID=A0ABV0HFB6_9ENTR